MATVIMDHKFGEHLRAQRIATGADRWDEVWEGTYMMTPLPNIEHQEIAGGLLSVIRQIVDRGQAIVLPGTNVSDRELGWEHNYRCPDVAVYLTGTAAKNCATHWCGGPDFAVEIVSDDDRTRDKIPFYSQVGTRELLIVERDPWRLELLRLDTAELRSVGTSTPEDGQSVVSMALPLTFCLAFADDRPSIVVTHTTDGRIWNV
jgi:Uma2 family endonuclease